MAGDSVWNQLPIEPTPGADDSSRDKLIFLRTEWLQDGINLRLSFLSDITKTWTGYVSYDDLHQRAEEFEIATEDFMQETRTSLTKFNGLAEFKYYCDLTRSAGSCRFAWKKCTGLTLVYGQVDLKRPVHQETFSIVQEFAILKENERKLRDEHETLKTCYTKATELMKAGQTDILSKCRLLINSKKAKIRELEDKLSKCQQQEEKPPVAVSTDSEDTPLAHLQMRKRARSLNRIFSQSSSPESEPILLKSLPKRPKVDEPESVIESCIADMNESSQITVLDSQPCDDDLFDQL